MKDMKSISFVLLLMALVLGGCSSSGGGGPSKFTKWTDLGPSLKPPTPVNPGTGTTLAFTGLAVDSSWTGLNGDISSVDGGLFGDATANLTYNGSGELTKAVVVTADKSTLTWDAEGKDTITDTGPIISLKSESGQDVAVLADSLEIGHNYQTFGAWISGNNQNSGALGAFSLGNKTTAGDVPATGNATFTGGLLGSYVDSAGTNIYTVAADTSINVDFAARNLVFSSSNTALTNVATQAASTNSNLNLTGSFSYASGSSSFSGGLNTTGGMNGTAQGDFYGPAAEELGGIFQLDGAGIEKYTGAFGAAR